MDNGCNTRISVGDEVTFVPMIRADGSVVRQERPQFLGLGNTALSAPAPALPGDGRELVPGFLPPSGLALLGGMEGSGKTILAQSLALTVALERADKRWCDLPVLKTGRAILVFAEGKEAMHKERARATCMHTLGLSSDETEKVLSRVDIVSLRSRMKELKKSNPKINRRLFLEIAVDGVKQFVPSPLLESIVDGAKSANRWADTFGGPEDRIALIVWDTLQGLYGFSLMNDEAINDANQWMNIAHDELGCAGLLIAHTIKSAAADDDDPRSSIKGSQQVQATLESVALLRFMNDAERDRVRKAGIEAPEHKLLALRFGKFNGRDPERTTRLLMGLPDGAPIGITSRVSAPPPQKPLAGGFTAAEMKAAVAKLFDIAWAREPEDKHSANSLSRLAHGESFLRQHDLLALKFVTHEGSASPKRKISTFLKELENEGILEGFRKGNATVYRPVKVSVEDPM